MPKKYVHIVKKAEWDAFVKSTEKRSADIKGRIAFVLGDLINARRPNKSIHKEVTFDQLKIAFPHFGEVINYIQLQVNVSRKLNRPFKISPILLLGDAGLGKTYFGSGLADLLGLPYYEISLATITANFALSGTSLQWGEGTPGFIIKTLAAAKVANPIIMIDELDKAGGDSRYSPISVFYSLLEPHSATRFKDEAIPLELDTSHVNWIATANNTNKIDPPILSRFKVFEITQPTPTEMLGVIDSIYSMLLDREDMVPALTPKLNESVKEQLLYQTPRSVSLALHEAMTSALFSDRNEILMEDIPISKQEARRVGFL